MGASFAFGSTSGSNPGALPLNSGSPSPATARLIRVCPVAARESFLKAQLPVLTALRPPGLRHVRGRRE